MPEMSPPRSPAVEIRLRLSLGPPIAGRRKYVPSRLWNVRARPNRDRSLEGVMYFF